MTLGLSEFRWYYGFFGVVMVVAFFSPAWKAYDYASRGLPTDAKVTEFAPRKNKLSGGSLVTFTFRDEAGTEYTGSDAVYGGWYPPSDNVIRIRYLPESPSQSAVVEGNIHRLPIVLFHVGVGIVILALIAELVVRRGRRKANRTSSD